MKLRSMPDRSRCRPSWARTISAALLVSLLGCSSGGSGGRGGSGGSAGRGGNGGGGNGGSGGNVGSTGGKGGGAGSSGTTGAAGATGGGGAGGGAAGAAGGATAGTGGSGATGGAGGGGATGGAGGAAATGGGAAGAGGAAGTGGDAGSGGATAGTGGGAGTSGALGAGGRGGAAGGSGGSAGGTGGAPATLWDWVGVVGTGQSLAVGGHGNAPAMTIGATTQRFGNLKLSLGSLSVPPYDPGNSALSMVPLVETIRPIATGYPSAYPRNIYGETFHTAMADELTSLVMAGLGHDFVTAHTVVGEAGQTISILQKGATDTGTTGRAYAASRFEVAAIARLAKAQGKSYGVGAIVLTHGESDAGSSTFEADMVKLWQSYNEDLPGLTGQTKTIPMLLSQQHAGPTTAGSNSPGTLAQWRIGLDHPGDIICTGPKYQYAYVNDSTHLTNPEYERLGEKYAEVMYQRVVLGNAWQPLQPTTVERSGRVITVHFHIPSPPLAWDTTLSMPHQSAFTEWAQGRGFEVHSGTTRIAISGVAIAGDSVQITCAADLPASGLVVGYASTADGTLRPNGTAHWGQLRDSDAFVGSMTHAAQPNYCVTFELNVP
jgi:hypothetical protein